MSTDDLHSRRVDAVRAGPASSRSATRPSRPSALRSAAAGSSPASSPRRSRTPPSPTRRPPPSSGATRRCRPRWPGSRDELRRTAEDGDLVIAVTDPGRPASCGRTADA
ncbi:hypothetical protein [Nocardioides sp. B-3]|uniref:hypothetical protein n=1 Tax=Nocardioides sp. B-3 TaxID=2895565 RepID=UPI00215263D7|nr:hypothetical protein [Nocardioides sp. B-3]UUZ57781.1 hypothetical protein LP418_15355 [Nocardioides sp. B-3]